MYTNAYSPPTPCMYPHMYKHAPTYALNIDVEIGGERIKISNI